MELRITTPADKFLQVIEWNHEEIKAEVAEKVAHYNTLVYTDEQIKDAKADRATLNKFVTVLEDKRKEVKKQCLAPYEEFEKKLKEITAIVQEPISLIDKQVKGYEEKCKADKMEAIKELFTKVGFQTFVTLDKIFNQKWLNASVKLSSIEQEMNDLKYQIGTDIAAINMIPEFAFEALEVYKTTLNLPKALEEAHRMSEIAKAKAAQESELKRQAEEQQRLKKEAEEKAKLEAEAFAMNPPVEAVEPEQIEITDEQSFDKVVNDMNKQWISFSAFLSVEDALALKEFFDSRNIDFKAI